jgi:hypothetical protein
MSADEMRPFMRTLKLLTLAAVVLLCGVSAYAEPYSDLYVIPAAGHTAGQNGTNWMTDVAIQNFQTTPLTVQIVVIEGGFDEDNVFPLATPANSGSATVPPRGSVLLSDVLAGHRGMATSRGALLVGADRPFAITSRTYSMSPAGDTVGQTVPGVGSFLDNTLTPIDPATAIAYVPGLIQNANFRTNLGFVAANGSGSGATMNIAVTVRGADGSLLGTTNYSVEPGAIMQMQFSARDVARANFDIGSAEFRIATGTGSVIPFASVIDNRTADAVFINGVFPQNMTPTAFGKGAAPSLFRSILDRMRVGR